MPLKSNPLEKIKGRGSELNQTGRFEKLQHETDLSDYGWMDADDIRTRKTVFLKDESKTILAENDSPDIPFRYSINPYRGCEHGCAYCYARPTHEYLGLSAGLDFETKIFYKEKAAELLTQKLMSKSWKPEMINISGVTDCYQPAENKFKITRSCLEVLQRFKNPVGIITKNKLITRDLDILGPLAKEKLIVVFISVTSLSQDLAQKLEPRTSMPKARLEAIEILSKAGVPVGVNVAPVIPGLTDHEIPAILKAVADHGALWAGFTPLRLPYSVKDLFADWLSTHFPDRKEKVLNYLKGMKEGNLNISDFGSRMRGTGPYAVQMKQLFSIHAKKYGLNKVKMEISTDLFARPGDQLALF